MVITARAGWRGSGGSESSYLFSYSFVIDVFVVHSAGVSELPNRYIPYYPGGWKTPQYFVERNLSDLGLAGVTGEGRLKHPPKS
jgi:hypothetical protein